MDTRPYTCCFTGHRNLPIHQEEEIWQRVCTRLYPLLERGVRYFGVGGAIGFDTLVAEKLLDLRKTYPQIRVILVQPFQGYQSRWTPAQQARAAAVENRVDKVVICCRTPGREAFLARDRHLVDGSAYCIGYCTRSTGGTAYTLRYAQKQGLQVWNIAEQQEETNMIQAFLK